MGLKKRGGFIKTVSRLESINFIFYAYFMQSMKIVFLYPKSLSGVNRLILVLYIDFYSHFPQIWKSGDAKISAINEDAQTSEFNYSFSQSSRLCSVSKGEIS